MHMIGSIYINEIEAIQIKLYLSSATQYCLLNFTFSILCEKESI